MLKTRKMLLFSIGLAFLHTLAPSALADFSCIQGLSDRPPTEHTQELQRQSDEDSSAYKIVYLEYEGPQLARGSKVHVLRPNGEKIFGLFLGRLADHYGPGEHAWVLKGKSYVILPEKRLEIEEWSALRGVRISGPRPVQKQASLVNPRDDLILVNKQTEGNCLAHAVLNSLRFLRLQGLDTTASRTLVHDSELLEELTRRFYPDSEIFPVRLWYRFTSDYKKVQTRRTLVFLREIGVPHRVTYSKEELLNHLEADLPAVVMMPTLSRWATSELRLIHSTRIEAAGLQRGIETMEFESAGMSPTSTHSSGGEFHAVLALKGTNDIWGKRDSVLVLDSGAASESQLGSITQWSARNMNHIDDENLGRKQTEFAYVLIGERP